MPALLREIPWKHNGHYYCINCLHPFRTEEKLKSHENLCKNHDYCHVKMPKRSISKCNHGEKSWKTPFTIYADTDSLLEKIDICHNNPKNSLKTNANKHTACGYS